jgi:hypothetical protein
MEPSANFGMSALIGGVLALIVVVLIVARILRPRRPPTAPPPATNLPHNTDPAFLDSSHIIGSDNEPPGTERDARKRPGPDSTP